MVHLATSTYRLPRVSMLLAAFGRLTGSCSTEMAGWGLLNGILFKASRLWSSPFGVNVFQRRRVRLLLDKPLEHKGGLVISRDFPHV